MFSLLRLGFDKPEGKDFDDVRTHDVKFKGVRFNVAKRVRRNVERQSIHQVKAPVSIVSTTTTRWRVFLAQMLKDSDNLQKSLAQLPVTVSLSYVHRSHRLHSPQGPHLSLRQGLAHRHFHGAHENVSDSVIIQVRTGYN